MFEVESIHREVRCRRALIKHLDPVSTELEIRPRERCIGKTHGGSLFDLLGVIVTSPLKTSGARRMTEELY